MKSITLSCGILWAMATLFSLYNLTLGDFPITEIFLDSIIDGLESIVWFLSDIAITVFFFVLWQRQA